MIPFCYVLVSSRPPHLWVGETMEDFLSTFPNVPGGVQHRLQGQVFACKELTGSLWTGKEGREEELLWDYLTYRAINLVAEK